MKALGFKIADQEYAVEISSVREVVARRAVVKIPDTGDLVEGVMSLRGQPMPVVDLRVRLNLEKRLPRREDRMLILQLENRAIAVIVDEVTGVMSFQEEALAPPDVLLHKAAALTGIGRVDERLVALLNPEKLFHVEEEDSLPAPNKGEVI